MPPIDYAQQQQGPQMGSIMEALMGRQQQQQEGTGLTTGSLSLATAMTPTQAMGGGGLFGTPTGQPLQPEAPKPPTGGSSIQELAQYLADSYGIPMGRQQLVDEMGNFTRMPTDAAEAARFNYIAKAVADARNRQQQAKSVAALQTEAGLVQKRGRGSLATLQAGTYRALAAQYNEMQYEADDFSYFIQEEFLRRQEEMVRKAEKLAKKRRRGSMWGGIAGAAIGTIVAPGVGTMAGYQMGSAVGGGMY
jgi:hypothetical protein